MRKEMINAEGYADWTAWLAIQNVEQEKKKWRPFVYICHMDTGDSKKNIRLEREYCRYALKKDAVPVSTVLLMTELFHIDRYMDLYDCADKILFKKAEELWVFGDISPDIRKKIERAEHMRKPVRYYTETMEEEHFG